MQQSRYALARTEGMRNSTNTVQDVFDGFGHRRGSWPGFGTITLRYTIFMMHPISAEAIAASGIVLYVLTSGTWYPAKVQSVAAADWTRATLAIVQHLTLSSFPRT